MNKKMRIIGKIFFVLALIGCFISCKKEIKIEAGFYNARFDGCFTDSSGHIFQVVQNQRFFFQEVTDDAIILSAYTKWIKKGNQIEGILCSLNDTVIDGIIYQFDFINTKGVLFEQNGEYGISGDFACEVNAMRNSISDSLWYFEGPYTLAGSFVMTKMKHLY